MWDKFARTETFKRVSNHGQTYSVKGLTTKTMNDVSVDETQIVGGDYMGRSINRLGNFTTGNGKPGSGRRHHQQTSWQNPVNNTKHKRRPRLL